MLFLLKHWVFIGISLPALPHLLVRIVQPFFFSCTFFSLCASPLFIFQIASRFAIFHATWFFAFYFRPFALVSLLFSLPCLLACSFFIFCPLLVQLLDTSVSVSFGLPWQCLGFLSHCDGGRKATVVAVTHTPRRRYTNLRSSCVTLILQRLFVSCCQNFNMSRKGEKERERDGTFAFSVFMREIYCFWQWKWRRKRFLITAPSYL